MVEEKLKEKEMKKENPEKVERPKEWPNPLKEMRENALILENKKFIEKYGLSKKKFEIHIEVSLKFNNSFQIVADYLR